MVITVEMIQHLKTLTGISHPRTQLLHCTINTSSESHQVILILLLSHIHKYTSFDKNNAKIGNIIYF